MKIDGALLIEQTSDAGQRGFAEVGVRAFMALAVSRIASDLAYQAGDDLQATRDMLADNEPDAAAAFARGAIDATAELAEFVEREITSIDAQAALVRAEAAAREAADLAGLIYEDE